MNARVSIDKIRVRMDFEGPNDPEYKQHRDWWYSVKDGQFELPGKVWNSHHMSALSNANQPLPGGGNLHIRYGKLSGKFRAFYQFNPSKASMAELAGHFVLLLDYGAQSLLDRATVSYCEVAVDLDGARFTDYLYLDTKLASGDAHHASNGSFYLGAQASDRRFICYDKRGELLSRHGHDLGHERLRLEARLQGKRSCDMAHMASISNPFRTLLVIDKSRLLASPSGATAGLRAALVKNATVDAQGLYGAMGRADRKAFCAAAQHLQAPWWQPDQVWKQYPQALAWRDELVAGLHFHPSPPVQPEAVANVG